MVRARGSAPHPENFELNPTRQTVAPAVERNTEIKPFIADYNQENGSAVTGVVIKWLWILWEQRRFLWRVTVLAFLIATVVAFLIPKYYQSTTRLMPPDQQSGSGMAMLAAMSSRAGPNLGGLASDLLGVKNSGDLFLDILRSRTVEDRLIERFDLRQVYWDKYWEDARKDLARNTELSEDRKSGVITISITDRDPHRAQQIAQAYGEELDRLVAEVSTSSARRQRMFIEERLKNVKQDLDAASRQFSQYASQNTAVDITAQAKAMLEAAARLEGELIAARSDLEGLQQIYAPDHVRVRSLRARVDELNRQLQKLGGDSAASVDLPDPKSQTEFPSIRQLPLLGVRWADLYRQTKIEETVYELLTQQCELAKIEEAKEIPVVKVLDAPVVPERKSSPHRLLIMVVSAMFAFLGGCVWLLGNALWRKMDPADPRKEFAEVVLATTRRRFSPLLERLRVLPRSRSALSSDIDESANQS